MVLRKIRNIENGISGFLAVWREEKQFPYQVAICILVLALAAYVRVSGIEFLILFATIALALASEIINTAIEDLCDKIEPNRDTRIGKIKDMSQAFVMIASLPAILTAVAVIAPRLIG